ncbi:hypothetical protein [Streptoalloteichus hindustanus]|uniref:Uncharacterized protein n=1 Tax=Streptoalloteichus hindustanus TaxID=2017 RepID=A0A1M4Y890_STRHI|nr:hypothetical protein [Streptoalloteichus hindustanus]SHF01945.1 hypothetical protein SAMN05444320_102274 [Streptoalloteichus hindustanus]
MAARDRQPCPLTDRLGLLTTADKGYVSHEVDRYPARRPECSARRAFEISSG